MYKFHDLQISDADLSTLIFALNEELRVDQRLLSSFPEESNDIRYRIDAMQRLIHVFQSGEWVDTRRCSHV